MGATTFVTAAKGTTPDEAFRSAVAQTRWEHGHGGYTGTIAEKTSWVPVNMPNNADRRVFVRLVMGQAQRSGDETREQARVRLIEGGIDAGIADAALTAAEKVDDKYGPAGCVELYTGMYLFFGWASE